MRRVQQLLAEVKDLKWEVPEKVLLLSAGHLFARVKWSRKHIRKIVSHWKRTVFSDESRFNLDGPDGIRAYWHDKHAAGRYVVKRRYSGGGWMIWAAFSVRGKTPLVFVDGTMN